MLEKTRALDGRGVVAGEVAGISYYSIIINFLTSILLRSLRLVNYAVAP